MISYLKGAVLYKTASSVMVLCGDVGYEVQIPAGRLLQYSLQQSCEFYIYYLHFFKIYSFFYITTYYL